MIAVVAIIAWLAVYLAGGELALARRRERERQRLTAGITGG